MVSNELRHIELLTHLGAQRGATIVVATHDTELAARAPRRLATRDGRLVEPLAPELALVTSAPS